MNRITIELDSNGNIGTICADSPVELYFVNPKTPHDRVYLYTGIVVGPQHVREQLGDYPVGHALDGTLRDSDILADYGKKLPPSRPTLKVVESEPSEEV